MLRRWAGVPSAALLLGAGLAFVPSAVALVPVASPVAFFPDRVDYPTVAPPASAIPALAVAVSTAYRGSRLIATAGGSQGVMVYESRPGAPVASTSLQQSLYLQGGDPTTTAVAFGSVLGHAREDLVAVGDGELSVYPRLARGGLLNPLGFGDAIVTALSDGTDQRDVQLADVNGDDRLDAVIADGQPSAGGSESVTVLFGNGDGTFSDPQVISVGDDTGIASVVRVADLNGDRRPDLVVGSGTCGDDNPEISVLLGQSGGGFGPPTYVGTADACLNDLGLTIADLNGDRDPDIVEVNTCCLYYNIGSVIVFLGNGDGSFQPGTTSAAGVDPQAVAAADFNGDGHIDLAVIGGGGMDVFPGDGTGGLLSPTRVQVPSGVDYYGSAISVADNPVDLNGDGAPDVVIGNDAGITIADSGRVGPSAGPYTGGTTVFISGQGFAADSTVAFGGRPASEVTLLNTDELSAVSPRLPRGHATAVDVTVSGPGAMTAPGAFRYYVPQIGRLVNSEPSACTGSVVVSPHHDIVVTAGHCVGGSGHLDSAFAFAPGYTGATCPAEIGVTDFFLCGDPPPFGVWSANRVGTNNQWLDNGDHALDYAFLDMNKNAGITIGRAVGGGLPIEFNSDRSQSWTAFGIEGGATTLRELSGNETDENVGSPGPSDMSLPKTFAGGASGGPWIGATSGAIGGVNSIVTGSQTFAAYLGPEAQGTFAGM